MINWLLIILAAVLVFPRGYLLVYVIDRAKCFPSGLKFFVGWLFGLCAFTIDVFASHALAGLPLAPWLFLYSALGQIIGLEIFIYLLERKIYVPNMQFSWFARQWQSFTAWKALEKALLVSLVMCTVVALGIASFGASVMSDYDRSIERIVLDRSLDTDVYTFSAIQYPFNDTLFKVWLSLPSGMSERVILVSSFLYYILLLGIFYHSLPLYYARSVKLGSTLLLSILSWWFFYQDVHVASILFAACLLLAIATLMHHWAGKGTSFFYLSGMGLAFGSWTQNEGLLTLFPLLMFVTLLMAILGQVRWFDFMLSWFFVMLTMFPWIQFLSQSGARLSSGEFTAFSVLQVMPLAIYGGVLVWQRLFGTIPLYDKTKNKKQSQTLGHFS